MASKRTKEILEKLDQVYTREYKCYLNYETLCSAPSALMPG